jgi:hypothetical protein
MKYQGKSVYTSSIRSKIPKATPNRRLRDWKLAAMKRIEANIRKRSGGGEHA